MPNERLAQAIALLRRIMEEGCCPSIYNNMVMFRPVPSESLAMELMKFCKDRKNRNALVEAVERLDRP